MTQGAADKSWSGSAVGSSALGPFSESSRSTPASGADAEGIQSRATGWEWPQKLLRRENKSVNYSHTKAQIPIAVDERQLRGSLAKIKTRGSQSAAAQQSDQQMLVEIIDSQSIVKQQLDKLSQQVSVEFIEIRRLMKVLGAAVGAVHKDLHHPMSTDAGHHEPRLENTDIALFAGALSGKKYVTATPRVGESISIESPMRCTSESVPLISGVQAIGHDDPVVLPSADFPAISPNKTLGVSSMANRSKESHGTLREIGQDGSFNLESPPVLKSVLKSALKASPSQLEQVREIDLTTRRSVLRDFKISAMEYAEEPSSSMTLQGSGNQSIQAHNSTQTTAYQFVGLPLLGADSTKLHVWDACGCCIMLYECVYIPLALAWQFPETTLLSVGMWYASVFWTFDMLLRFNTTFYVNGQLETKRSAIALNYIKHHFAFDAAATGADWVTALLFATSPFRRRLRLLRFLRLSSMWRRLEKLHDLFLSDAWHACVQLFMIILLILLVNHFVCCSWYYLGDQLDQDTGRGWLQTREYINGQSVPYAQFSAIFQYATSYQWSVSQMFVGSSQIVAYNSKERTFNIAINLFGMFFTAVITAWLSALWVQDHQSKRDINAAMQSVRRYLRQHRLNPQTETSILKHLKIRLSAKQFLSEADVHALHLLPKSLKSKMRLEIWNPALLRSPVMFLLNSMDNSILLNLCFSLDYIPVLGGDEIFEPRTKLNKTYVIVHGVLHYTYASPPEDASTDFDLSDNFEQNVVPSTCDEGLWIAEAALWCDDWSTVGHMHCCTVFAEIVGVRSEHLRTSLPQTQTAKAVRFVQAYGAAYRDLIESLPAHRFSDVEPPLGHPMVVMNMTAPDRLMSCRPMLQQLVAKERSLFTFQGRPLKGVSDIEAEIRTGECCLIFDEEGQVMRIAIVVLLRTVRSDGMLLIHVAKIIDGCLTPKLQMPATKTKEEETPHEAAQRIFRKSLEQIGGDQELGACERTAEVRDTPNYGMKTCFYRAIYHVSFKESSAIPLAVVIDMESVSRSQSRKGFGLLSVSKSFTFGSGKLSYDQLPTQFYFVKSEASPHDGALYAWMSPSTYAMLEEDGLMLSEWVSCIRLPASCEKRKTAGSVWSSSPKSGEGARTSRV